MQIFIKKNLRVFYPSLANVHEPFDVLFIRENQKEIQESRGVRREGGGDRQKEKKTKMEGPILRL